MKRVIPILFVAVMCALMAVTASAAVKCSHENLTFVETLQKPTESRRGIDVYKCDDCSKYVCQYTTVSASRCSHDYVEYEAKAPTCLTVGWEAYRKCSLCGDSDYKEIPATGHINIVQKKVNVASATCNASGRYWLKTVCSDCGTVFSSKYYSVAKLEHQPGAPVRISEKVATCTEKGSYTEVTYCTLCRMELSRTVTETEALGHVGLPSVVENYEPAHCETPVKFDRVVYCELCGEEVSRLACEGEAPGHKVVTDKAVSPTCVDSGLTEGSHCAVCKQVLVEQQYVKPKGHSYKLLSVTASDCTHNGERVYKCEDCDSTYSEVIEAEHKHLRFMTYVDGGKNIIYYCEDCRNYLRLPA